MRKPEKIEITKRFTEIKTKICAKCKQCKPVEEFSRNPHNTDSLHSWCKNCQSIYRKEYFKYRRSLPEKEDEKVESKQADTKPPVDSKRRVYATIEEGDIYSSIPWLCERVVKTIFDSHRITKSDEQLFGKAYQEAMEFLHGKLLRSLVAQSVGFYYDEVKTVYQRNSEATCEEDKWIEIRKEITRKFQPANATLFTFLLCNKFPNEFRKELFLKKDEGYDSQPAERIRKVIESLSRDVLEQSADKSEGKSEVPDSVAQLPGAGG